MSSSSSTIRSLQRERDNLIFALNYMFAYEELSEGDTTELETKLSAVEDELVLLMSHNEIHEGGIEA